jgi:methionyl aminopeptidase
VLRDGDIIKLDTACKLNGWCADAAVTLPVGETRPELQRLIKVAWETLDVAIVELGRRR